MNCSLRVILTLLVAGLAPIAWAHAFLERAEPAVGRKVSLAPATVQIWFTEPVEAAFSSIKVFSASGQEVDKRDTQVDPTQRQLLRVSLEHLTPGKYRVVWKAVSVDTHTTTGKYEFEVAQ
jgi:methionine-rich copper-binding protein CopC